MRSIHGAPALLQPTPGPLLLKGQNNMAFGDALKHHGKLAEATQLFRATIRRARKELTEARLELTLDARMGGDFGAVTTCRITLFSSPVGSTPTSKNITA